jgi:hypothetical protein
MTALKTFLDNALAALASIQRGDPAGITSPTEGMLCWDNTGVPDVLKRYTAEAGWITLLTVNVSTGAVTISDLTLTKLATGFSAAGGTTSRTLTVDISRAISDLLLADGSNLAIGSDADGDTYYRASGKLARRAKGTAGQVWTMNAEATAPIWSAIPANAAAGTPSLRKLGTGATDAAAGNDSRFGTPDDDSVTTAKLKAPTAALTTLITRIRETELPAASGGGAAVVGAAVVLNDGAFCLYTQLKSSSIGGGTTFRIYVNGALLIELTTNTTSYTAKTYNLTGMSAGDKIYCTLDQTSSGTGYCRYVRLYSGTSAPASAVCIYPYDTY